MYPGAQAQRGVLVSEVVHISFLPGQGANPAQMSTTGMVHPQYVSMLRRVSSVGVSPSKVTLGSGMGSIPFLHLMPVPMYPVGHRQVKLGLSVGWTVLWHSACKSHLCVLEKHGSTGQRKEE